MTDQPKILTDASLADLELDAVSGGWPSGRMFQSNDNHTRAMREAFKKVMEIRAQML
jgi:hypothetical protein